MAINMDQVKGRLKQATGKLKAAAGKAVGNPRLACEGRPRFRARQRAGSLW